jgi:cyclopropane fatty-acyl-phospholipid synthase-like methyltransferase
MAALADKYDLYQRSVQSPECDVGFFLRTFKTYYGRPPLVLREDFCGTAAVCCEWVESHKDRRAIGVDLDPEPLSWGKKHNLARLSDEARARVSLLEADVRAVRGPKADVIAAQNFSFYLFLTREGLREYFRAAHRNLAREGIMVLDMLGGPECMEDDLEEVRGFRSFKYVWEQARFDPITHDCRFHIHFRFPDGSEMRRAFTYDWRLWSIPEVRELLAEAGFRLADVYWEGTDSKTGKGNDRYRRRTHAESDPAWVAYLVAVK